MLVGHDFSTYCFISCFSGMILFLNSRLISYWATCNRQTFVKPYVGGLGPVILVLTFSYERVTALKAEIVSNYGHHESYNRSATDPVMKTRILKITSVCWRRLHGSGGEHCRESVSWMAIQHLVQVSHRRNRSSYNGDDVYT